MARPKETTPGLCDPARLRWLQKQLREVRGDREAASEAGSHSAVAALRREERALRDQIDAARLIMEEAKLAANPPKLTDAQRAQILRERVDNAADEELEVAIEEWLRRRRYDLVVDDGGRLHLVAAGDSPPDLRLVTA